MANLNSEEMLKEAGFTPDEIAQWKTTAGAKFDALVAKVSAQVEQAQTETAAAKAEHEKFTKDYQDIYLPQLKKTTSDSLAAEARAAAAEAALRKAKEAYGLEIDDPSEVRAPVSGNQPAPSADFSQFEDKFNRLQKGTGSLLSQMNRINNESQRLFGKLPEDLDSLAEEAARESTMGRNVSLYEVWERKSGAQARRDTIATEAKAKEKADMRAEIEKEIAEKSGQHPGLIPGRPSRFSQFEPQNGNGGDAWKYNHGMRKSSNAPWRDFAAKKVAAAGVSS